ncbi:MAG: hypothetical protein EOP56_04460 [Sphingobacteriales bacterium]|nr:MAG: hypothetical protein EOP56_04460 [Sphingobacteriales bacterium]
MKKRILLIVMLIGLWQIATAQHEHHNMNKPATPARKATPKKKSAASPKKATTTNAAKSSTAPHTSHSDTAIHNKPEADTMHGEHHQMHEATDARTMEMSDTGMHNMQHTGMGHSNMDMPMSHAYSLNLPMNRNGSGTSWLPDNSAMYGYMLHAKKWMFMFHGNIFVRYNKQDLTNQGSRGGSKVDAPNMFMAMGQRKVGSNGLFRFGTMLSLDAAIAGGSGYPLLFQSGETWQGKPLIDRQHPHDLFSELSVSYAHAFSPKADAYVYLGYPGEPAIGAVTFMHRPSGMFNPDAPIGHHWVDATHITFGVATIGVRYGKFKIEGSSFTGREPNEQRFDFDKPRFDSRSARLSFNPNKSWALQVSHGFLKSPEVSHPGEDINRTTASATYSYRLGQRNFIDVTGLWALNKIPGEHGSNAALLEATLRLKKLALYSRYEWVQKSGEELALEEPQFDHHKLYPVNALTAGASYDVLEIWKTRLALGAQLSVYRADAQLRALYGNAPLAGQIYMHIYPSLMR